MPPTAPRTATDPELVPASRFRDEFRRVLAEPDLRRTGDALVLLEAEDESGATAILLTRLRSSDLASSVAAGRIAVLLRGAGVAAAQAVAREVLGRLGPGGRAAVLDLDPGQARVGARTLLRTASTALGAATADRPVVLAPPPPPPARGTGSRRTAADWPEALRQALARPEQMRLAFQPIVDLRRATACGYEALARFGGPSPTSWFAAATREGSRAPLELLALRRALAHGDRVPAGCFLSVNLSPEVLLTTEASAALAQAGHLGGVVVEVVERTAPGDERRLRRALDGLRERGARIAVDDVGAGYSGLRRVLALRPEFVKLDRTLVAGLDQDPARRAAVRSLRDFATDVGALMVAEGVERLAELEALVDLGVPLAQGFLLGRPGAGMSALAERVAGETRALAARADLTPGVGRLVGATGTPHETALTVGPGDLPADVLRQAMARPPECRFAPVTVRAADGMLLGLVAVERLVEAVTGSAGPAPRRTSFVVV